MHRFLQSYDERIRSGDAGIHESLDAQSVIIYFEEPNNVVVYLKFHGKKHPRGFEIAHSRMRYGV